MVQEPFCVLVLHVVELSALTSGCYYKGRLTPDVLLTNPLPLILIPPTLTLNIPNIIHYNIPQWGVFDIRGVDIFHIRGRGLPAVGREQRNVPYCGPSETAVLWWSPFFALLHSGLLTCKVALNLKPRGLGFRVLGFQCLGFRVLGFRV